MGTVQDTAESYDIVIIGAGIAGINCAYRLQTRLPEARITLLEARDAIGGTWDFFKYPGLRSDSDLETYSFAWEPWPYATPIAEAHLIMSYLHHCVAKYGLGKYMNFRHKVTAADWSSESKRWTLAVDNAGQKKRYGASFVVLGTGYYDYDTPWPAIIPGLDSFQGKVVHPQFWPTDYDFTDKDVVVIGSGATTITLLPNLAPMTRHTTMLQRSPSYVVSVSNVNPFATWWFLPKPVRYWLSWTHVFVVFHWRTLMCYRYPEASRAMLLQSARAQLPAHIPVDPHFTPRYNPWQQRLCLAPNGDFFQSLHGTDGQPPKASIVTGTIRTVTADGIALDDGRALAADVIVTATGLKLLFGGGIPFRVDGELVAPHEHAIWDGCMLNDVPNLVFMTGYATASWTVGVDNTAITLCRLWKQMRRAGKQVAVPKLPADRQIADEDKRPFLDLTSTYITANKKLYPFTISWATGPWKARGNIWVDWLYARCGAIGRALALS